LTREPVSALPNVLEPDEWARARENADCTPRIPILGLLGPPKGRLETTPFTMSSPYIFSLPDRLLIEVISNLSPNDIHACRLTCRQLNDLIVNSQLIQYIIRTALSGVFDPLDPGFSLPERLDALHQWETTWAELNLHEPDARIDAPVPSGRGPPVEFSFGRYFVVIREGYGRSAGYSFLDMHSAFSPDANNAALWTTIKIDTPNVLVFAFATELDLAVAISCVRSYPRSLVHTPLLPSCFSSSEDLLNPRRLGHPMFRTDEEQL